RNGAPGLGSRREDPARRARPIPARARRAQRARARRVLSGATRRRASLLGAEPRHARGPGGGARATRRAPPRRPPRRSRTPPASRGRARLGDGAVSPRGVALAGNLAVRSLRAARSLPRRSGGPRSPLGSRASPAQGDRRSLLPGLLRARAAVGYGDRGPLVANLEALPRRIAAPAARTRAEELPRDRAHPQLDPARDPQAQHRLPRGRGPGPRLRRARRRATRRDPGPAPVR